MKITESQLRTIVRQELKKVLNQNDQQLDEGFGKVVAGLGLAAMLALGYGGVQASQQQAREVAHQIEQVRQDVTKLTPQQKVALVKFNAGANAIKAGQQPEQIRKIEDDAAKSFMVDGKISEKALDSHLSNAISKNPRLVKDFLQGLKEVK